MSELLKDTWETKGPISKKIRERIKKTNKRGAVKHIKKIKFKQLVVKKEEKKTLKLKVLTVVKHKSKDPMMR